MMERTSGHHQILRCWRLVNLALTLSLVVVVGASALGKPFDHEDEDGEVTRAYQPNGSVRSKRGPSTQISPQPLAVSAGGPLYSLTSASVRCVLLNASAIEASRGEWCWTVLYPAAGAHSHVLRAATNVVIAFSLPGSLRGSTAVSQDGLASTITVFSVQQLRGYVNVSCLWKLSDGAHSNASYAQPRAKSATIYGPPHIADCQLASVSYTSASIDWLPLKADGKIAPFDRYTIEVVHGTKTIQRVEKTGTITHLVLPDVLQPDTLYTATLFGSNSAGNGPPCHVSFSTNEVAALAIQSCPVLDSNGQFYLIAAWKPQFPESLVSYQCELRRQGVKSKVWSESTRSQCAAGQARVVPAANSTAAALGSYQMEVIESLGQNTAHVLQYTTTLTVEIDYVSASAEYIGDGTYLVTCELACHSQLTGCAVYLKSSRTGAVGTDWDELSTIPVNAQRDMALLGISRPMAVWNVTLYGYCVESMGVQAARNGKVVGQVKSIMVAYHTTTAEADCAESSHPSSWPNSEMEIIIAVLALLLVLICILCCVILIALLKWNCSHGIKKRCHLHLGHSVFPTYAHPIFLRTPLDQPRTEEQQQRQQRQQQGPNGDHPQDNAAPVLVRHIDLEHVDHSYDCDTV